MTDARAATTIDILNDLTGRAVPLEQRLLGSIILHAPTLALIADRIAAEDFGEEIHRRIFEAAKLLAAQGKAPNLFAMRAVLTDADLKLIGQTDFQIGPYLARLCAEAALPALASQDADLIREFAQRRFLVRLARDLEAHVGEAGLDQSASMISLAARDALDLVTPVTAHSTRRDAGAAAAELIAYAQGVRDHTITSQGVTTGFRQLDDWTGGYEPGMLWILAARPGVGKTVYMAASGIRVARRGGHAIADGGQGFGVLEFSLEVPERQIIARHLADLSYRPSHPIEFSRILRGDLDESDDWALGAAQKALMQMPLVIDCAPRLTLQEISARVRQERATMAKQGVRLAVVFIDYLKFIKASDRYKGQRHYEVGEISAGLKELAKQEDLCVVLLAQLNRALEARDDKRPGLADLRESGDLEADADVVAFLHRESYHIEKSPAYRAQNVEAIEKHLSLKHDAEVILGKNRAGPTSIAHLWCDVACSSMSNQSRGEGL
jgi:replicative DNA helicase